MIDLSYFRNDLFNLYKKSCNKASQKINRSNQIIEGKKTFFINEVECISKNTSKFSEKRYLKFRLFIPIKLAR